MKHFTFYIQLLLFIIAVPLFVSCKNSVKKTDSQLQLIPMPNSVVQHKGSLDITKGVQLKATGEISEMLLDYISSSEVIIQDENGVYLQLSIVSDGVSDKKDESYSLAVGKSGIEIGASDETGLFYGIQTLMQLINIDNTKLPYLRIEDSPRFAYRGLMLDCSRHFLSLDFLKKQIDMMAYLKLNRFHWHLTDGPGWRLQIDQYPELTEIAAWRPQATWKEWWNSGRQYVKEGTEGAYGGYYTQDEARELVEYAAERHIVVIPEIEIPGHSEEVLAVYPHLSCTGKPYTSSEVCIGNPDTYTFLENVLDEVIGVFPSEYIHIGGDEASREHWTKCPKCQSLMKKEGYTEEAQLQSHLIKHIEEYLNNKGRMIIGWDEILEGGLAPNATVMSWRGEDGGIAAARSGHDAIMTPGSHCYFDSYQGTPDTQPEAIGGFLPIEKVYSFNPVSDSLTIEESKHILGAQANLWAEYIISEKHMEYMIYPRLLALAEVVWTQPENKSWDNFKIRANTAIPFLQQKGYNTYTLSEEPFMELSPNTENKSIDVTLTSERYPVDIRYTVDGTLPSEDSMLYESVIEVKDSAIIVAQIFRHGESVGRPVEKRVDYHKAIGKSVDYVTPYSKYYTAGGDGALVDGLPGGLSHGDGHWQGFLGAEIELVVDMGELTTIKSISTRFLQTAGAEIWLPKEVAFLVSDDNENYTELMSRPNVTNPKSEGTLFEQFEWKGDAKGRYLKVKSLRKDGIGGWLFLDEIVVW